MRRIDTLIIWGHGLQYCNDIIRIIEKQDELKIIRFKRHKIKSFKRLIKSAYRHQTVPWLHLRAKTSYLKSVRNECMFIFIENNYDDADYIGEREFRHMASPGLNRLKVEIRQKYNPKVGSMITHDHVIHTTDSNIETDTILRYLKDSDGINYFSEDRNNIFGLPGHIVNTSESTVYAEKLSNIFCRVVVGQSWDSYKHIVIPAGKTPAYKGLYTDISIYEQYLEKYRGGALQDYYSSNKLLKLNDHISKCTNMSDLDPITVRRLDSKIVVMDGMHRVSCLRFNNRERVIVREMNP